MGHAIQSNPRREAVARAQSTPLRAPAFGAREAGRGELCATPVRGEARSFRVITDDRGRVQVMLEGYGYRWLRLMSRDSRRLA